MSELILREAAGRPLTNAEIDGNFTYLDDGKTDNSATAALADRLNSVEQQTEDTQLALDTHENALDPHPQYLTQDDANSLYDPLGAAQSANAISLNGLPADMGGGLDGYMLKITGTSGDEKIVAVPASSIATAAATSKHWFSTSTESIDSSTYNLTTYIQPVGVSTEKSNAITLDNSENLIAEFASSATTSTFTIDAGLWSFKMWDSTSKAGTELRIKLFILDEATSARTQVGMTHSFQVENTLEELDSYEIGVVTPIDIVPGERLVFSLYAYSTFPDQTITIRFGGTDRQSYVDVPTPATHNALAGLQGGAGTERYHLSVAELAKVQGVVAFVKSQGANVNGNWRIWSDGLIEQWGRVLVSSAVTVTDVRVAFPISFLNDTYEFICSSESKSTVGDSSYACCALNRRTLSSTYVSSRRTGGITADNYITWRAVS